MIFYVRHGQTDDNLKGIFTGDSNTPLNETGFEQARVTAQLLKNKKIDIVYCSPLTRARQTAGEIMKFHKGVPLVIDERIEERDDGDFKGKPTEGLDAERWNLNNDKFNKTGESIAQVYARVKEFYDEILKKHQNENVLVVAHNGIARLTKSYFLGFPESGNMCEYDLGNAEVLVLSK